MTIDNSGNGYSIYDSGSDNYGYQTLKLILNSYEFTSLFILRELTPVQTLCKLGGLN